VCVLGGGGRYSWQEVLVLDHLVASIRALGFLLHVCVCGSELLTILRWVFSLSAVMLGISRR